MAYRRSPVWAGSVVGMLYIYGITQTALAEKLGWSRRYLSMVLHGDRTPKNAEKRVNAALNELMRDRTYKIALQNYDKARES